MDIPPSSGLRNRLILYSASVAGMQRLLQIVGTLITIPLILHALGTDGFGQWGAATSLGWLGTLLDLGVGAALITLVAQGMAGQNTLLVREQITAGMAGASLMAGLVLIFGIAFVYLTLTGSERVIFLIAVVGLSINIPLSMASSIWMGLQKGYIAGGWEIVQTILNISGLLWAAFTGAGTITMVAVFYGSTVLASILSFMHLMLAHPQLRPVQIILPKAIWRQVLSKSALFSALSIAAGIGYALDNVLALALLGSTASAQMAIVLRIGINAIGIISVLTQPLWPAFTDAHGNQEQDWAKRTLILGTIAIALMDLAGAAILVVFGQEILRWWLHNNLVNIPLLWAMAFWIFVLTVPRVAALLFNAISVLRFQIVACSAASIVALALKYFYASRFGVAGIFLATPLCWLVILWPAYLVKLFTWWQKD